MFDQLQTQAPDPLLSLIALHRADPRADKIDLGVGVYRNTDGHTPIMAAVKNAEQSLVDVQRTKAYLGPEGDVGFLDLIQNLVFSHVVGDRMVAIQTPGGTGALRLAADLALRSQPSVSITLGLPSWPIHVSIFNAARVTISTFTAFDVPRQTIEFDAVLDAIKQTPRDHLVLLHASCQNPTGAEFSREQWTAIAEALGRAGAVPLIDMAYHGLGDGLATDAIGVDIVTRAVPRAMIAYSCDKNFGLYRERTGALFVTCTSGDEAERVRSNAHALARANWSMPPDHGAAVVRTILCDPDLEELWRDELDQMQLRLRAVRQALASAGEQIGLDLSFVSRQRGLFSLLDLTMAQVVALRERFAIYAAGSGRINVAGLSIADCPRVALALADIRE